MDEKSKAIATLIVDAIIVFNMAAQVFGWTPVQYDAQVIYQLVSAALLLIATVYTWWRNMNVTSAAQLSQKVLDSIEGGSISENDVTKLLDGGDDNAVA